MDISQMKYHQDSEQIVKVLMDKTLTPDPLFFRILVGFYLSLAASQMRWSIKTLDRGVIPINMYALNLAPSGFGKSLSCSLMETEILGKFRTRYMEDTFPNYATDNLAKLATWKAGRFGKDPDDVLRELEREFNGLGSMLFSFDSGTSPALKQLRQKLLMARAGSLNFIVDEIGTNLKNNKELFDIYLELFDKGIVKQKLIKNSNDNPRGEEVFGMTPANLLMFGVPNRLFNGDATEDEFMAMLADGYARRCFFGYVKKLPKKNSLTPEDIFNLRTNSSNATFVEDISDRLYLLADPVNLHRIVTVSKDVTLKLIEYKLFCEKRAENLMEHQVTLKAELINRDYKVLKLAGAYAFLDDALEIKEHHLDAAIRLAEDSGIAFETLMVRDKSWVKLAKYIASVKQEVTQADLAADLPFYKGTSSAKSEMMTLAIAYGYRNNIIIKKRYEDGIEFLRGETIEETDLNKLILSCSTDITYKYEDHYAPWDKLHQMTQAPDIHWVNHHLLDGHRNEANCIKGFNLLVLDVDTGTTIDTVKSLFKDYTYLIYTTKRHTQQEHRFRIVLPMNYTLKLEADEYKEFMNNIYETLPFSVDTATGQRSRKWLSNAQGHYFYNQGSLFDVLPFIPKTKKNEERKQHKLDHRDMDNLERWVMQNSGDGNRNNMLLRYALLLVDSGLSTIEIQDKVIQLNDKLPDKLSEQEILGTIMVTVSKRAIDDDYKEAA